MTDEELIAIVERADREMTPGEWVVYGSDRYCKEMPVEAVISSGENERGTALGRIVVWPGRDAFGDEEAAGIVALRNNAGAIVQALRRLTQERDAARAKLNDCHGLADIMSRIEQDRDNISVALAAERERREKAERERERDEAKEDADMSWNVLSMIKARLKAIGCGCPDSHGDGTPPMCYDDWISCAVSHHKKQAEAERDAAIARVKELEGIMSNTKEKS